MGGMAPLTGGWGGEGGFKKTSSVGASLDSYQQGRPQRPNLKLQDPRLTHGLTYAFPVSSFELRNECAFRPLRISKFIDSGLAFLDRHLDQ